MPHRTYLKMQGERVFLSVLLASLYFCVRGHTTKRPHLTMGESGPGSIGVGNLKSVLESAVSPAFGATIIIIITVIVSGSAYICFLKYICAGCCKPTQVAPVVNLDPNKSEEQV